MRKTAFLTLIIIFTLALNTRAQQKEPWTTSQLVSPALLAEKIENHETANTEILCIGPGALIKGSVDLGPAQEAENLDKLKDHLKKVSKEKEVIIYCGCCPFDKCPNIRPAFQALADMGFTNRKLLDIPKNIKVDWLDKKYPVNE